MNKRKQRRVLRREIGKYGWAMLLYYLILNVAVVAVCEINLIYEGFRAVIEGDSWANFTDGMLGAMEAVYTGNGWGYLIACALAVGFLRLWKGKDFFTSMFATKQDMTAATFLRLACLFFGGQMVFQIVAVMGEWLANLFGLSVMESMYMASSGADTVSMFLYMGLVAPLVEEIIFRGLLLRGLEPFGKRFAIFASALMFGVFHGNLVQSPYAFVVGLVLGYVAMEYNILWAMVLHMMNNLLLGDTLPRLMSGLPAGASDLVLWLFFLACFLGGILLLVRGRKEIRSYRRRDPMDRQCLWAFATAVPNVIFFVIMLWGAVSVLFW